MNTKDLYEVRVAFHGPCRGERYYTVKASSEEEAIALVRDDEGEFEGEEIHRDDRENEWDMSHAEKVVLAKYVEPSK